MTTIERIHDLAKAVRGPVARPTDAAYAGEVCGFNVAITHAPELVVGATCTDDVVAAVRFAADAGLPVVAHATGHGAARPVDGGLLVNTSRMTSVTIDPDAGTATVGAGAKWQPVLTAGAWHGLGGLCGSSSDVGVVGYTLGGGLPVLGRAFGYAADYVRSMQVVTADGQLREVDAQTEPELFWALRGGTGNFGLVTSMTFELLPLTRVYGGGVFFAGEHAAGVLEAYESWVGTVPDELCSSLAMLRLPPAPGVPELLAGTFVIHLRVAYPGDAAAADQVLAPMRACAPVLLETVGELPYTHLDSIHADPDHPVPFVETGCVLPQFAPDARARLLDLGGPASGSPLLMIEVRHLGAALNRPPAHGDAIGSRGAGLSVFGVGIPAGPRAGEVPEALEALRNGIAPYSSGTFVNLRGAAEPDDRHRAWPADTYARLRRVKAMYDPDNLFRSGNPFD
jgi:FAD/FMN-containing dehydrogenase